MTDDEGAFRDRKLDYRKSEIAERMQVPKNLDDDSIIDFYTIPSLNPYADKDFIYQLPIPAALITGDQEAVKLQALANQQWVLITDSPSRLWPRLKQFMSQHQLLVATENISIGMIQAKASDGYYTLKVEQGFQRNTSELYVRFSSAPKVLSYTNWPSQQATTDKESALIGLAAQFLADASDKPAYSYVARGISAQKKMRELQNEAGFKSLLLEVDSIRARASLESSLKKAEFKIISQSTGTLTVQYFPLLPESKRPGFWGRLFGKNPEGLNEDILFAGEHYLIHLKHTAAGQEVSVERDSDAPSSARNARNELNQVIQLIKGYIS